MIYKALRGQWSRHFFTPAFHVSNPSGHNIRILNYYRICYRKCFTVACLLGAHAAVFRKKKIWGRRSRDTAVSALVVSDFFVNDADF